MRLWSLHPAALDRQGLTACWREGLLAQAVLAGRTRGYTRHPQLLRFQQQPEPLESIGAYLAEVAAEADARGYRFDRARIDRVPTDGRPAPRIPVSEGQLAFELAHLRRKLTVRSPKMPLPAVPLPHPLFTVEPGPIAEWERPDPIVLPDDRTPAER
ncbi:pyrimidine dimer DNA glycosylase/endonuclease V [Agrococcus sp. ProA11]|uniref:pyrimidine dimer DNA glycosylase/endonuclease V n=1 Tax=Agrococcus chionoecetis TaxID=3153752 RepID=UPI0032606371